MMDTRRASGPGLAGTTGPANSIELNEVIIFASETFFLYHFFRRLPLAGQPPTMHAVRRNDEFTGKPPWMLSPTSSSPP